MVNELLAEVTIKYNNGKEELLSYTDVFASEGLIKLRLDSGIIRVIELRDVGSFTIVCGGEEYRVSSAEFMDGRVCYSLFVREFLMEGLYAVLESKTQGDGEEE